MAKRVLIVDDEPRYLRLLDANLRTEGYDVVTAQDGQQAIEVFSGQPVDLILLDIMMPRLDGFGTCQRIREFSSVPIIILTAKGEEQDRVRGLDLGVLWFDLSVGLLVMVTGALLVILGGRYKGGDFADLYFQHSVGNSLTLEDGVVAAIAGHESPPAASPAPPRRGRA